MQKSKPIKPWVDVLHGQATAWVILSISLIITIIAWYVASNYSEQRALNRFEYEVREAESAIEKRFTVYEQVLRGGLGLFKSSIKVDRKEWNEYITTLKLDKYYPGTLGVGYSVWLKPDELSAHIESVRAEGFTDFTVKPAGQREQYSSIVYLEPFNSRNQRAFGFDMYSEKTRRLAMSRARETGETALSGKVTLVQETNSDVQAGFLIYIPHYSKPVNTVEERRESLLGFVYSALRIGDLMHGILGSGLPEIDFKIYDTENVAHENLLYDSNNNNNQQKQTSNPEKSSIPAYSTISTLNMGGHVWTINYSTNDTFNAATQGSEPTLVAVGGVIIDILLFNVILSLTRLRKKALSLADSSIQQLHEREMHFKAISDTAYDGIVSLSGDRLITYANRSAAEIFGLTEEEIIGKEFITLFPENYHGQLNSIIDFTPDENCSRHPNEELLEIEGLRHNGECFPVEISTAYWVHEETRYITFGLRDITDRRRVERMKSEFVSTVSHELRTPLTAIFGSLSLIDSGIICKLNKEAAALIETAKRNCERLTRLVNDILDVEKMESGKMNLNYEKKSIAQLMEQAVEINNPVAQQVGVKIILDIKSRAVVQVDVDRIMQLFTNLISNAIKFAPPNSEVKITVSDTDTSVHVAVSDNGPGIPNEFKDVIFSKFAQVDGSDRRKYSGSGLGLHIAKNIITQHKGSIEFESEPDVETTFFVTLPKQLSA